MLPSPGFTTSERMPPECTLGGHQVPVLVRLNDTSDVWKGRGWWVPNWSKA